MQSNLNNFLGLSESDSEESQSDFVTDQLQRGKHYWTGVKTTEQLSEQGKSDYDIYDDILTLQQTAEYANVDENKSTEYVFDPDKFGKKDPTLVTENYKLDTEKLKEYGRLATKLRLLVTERSESLYRNFQSQ